MRISDWSSDVCSSDLAGDVQAAGVGVGLEHVPQVAPVLLPHVAHQVRGQHAVDGAFAGVLRFKPRARVAVQLDRKSVVKGKSVSVRVDLGGRRSINKKKTKTEASAKKIR